MSVVLRIYEDGDDDMDMSMVMRIHEDDDEDI